MIGEPGMKIIVAMDSFKESLFSYEAGEAVKKGVLCAIPSADVDVLPVSDGGEGMTGAFLGREGTRREEVLICGPLSEKVKAVYAVMNNGRTAVLESASACGLDLIPSDKRNPINTTTYGLGELILDAVAKGCRDIVIGLGGSGTNDGGIGMLSALGFEFLDEKGEAVGINGSSLENVRTIRIDNAAPVLKECTFTAACDVTNPLNGVNGCSAVFGPQKGLASSDVEIMDGWLSSYAAAVKKTIPDADEKAAGSGAAGGLGFALKTFLNADLKPGIDMVLEYNGFHDLIKEADCVITGEGRLDEQTAMGKVPAGIAKAAGAYGVPVIAFGGAVGDGADKCNACGIEAYFPVIGEPMDIHAACRKETASENLRRTAEQVFRLKKSRFFQPVICTTICYLEKDGKYLMLHRTKKEKDVNKGKWIGIGGHLEKNESPEDCARREVFEESGIVMNSEKLRGIVSFISGRDVTDIMMLYTSEDFTEPEEEYECNEGVLKWVEKEKISDLNLWPGDRIFLKLLYEDAPFFTLKLVYDENDELCDSILNGVKVNAGNGI